MIGIKNDTHNFQARAVNFARVLCLLVLALTAAACPRNNKGPGPRVGVSDRPANATTPVSLPTAFNGERAMDHVRKQIEFGPRIAGSAQLAKTREYIINTLRDSGIKVFTYDFSTPTPIGERKMVDVIAEIPGESKDVIIISSHYDTKLYTNMQFVGANDPGSSVATLLEIARVLPSNQQKPKFTYWLVFFDGEEAFCEGWEQCGKPDAPDNTYGSRWFVEQLRKNNELVRTRAMILLDMMGYKNLELGRDDMSTRWLQDIVWRTAHDLGYGKYFVDRPEGVGGDDHEPFLRAGIDSLDLIQLSGYPFWHRADDTADKISPQSMKIVGDVVLASLPRVEQYLQSKSR
ncbi:MAG TPA: M28 family metallopeptidase [Pyrinomonadaceae bacterium]|nr:M28 family metallopeptidase [Pyrinomonadaceae bacterium]